MTMQDAALAAQHHDKLNSRPGGGVGTKEKTMAAWFEGMFGAEFGALGMWTTILLAAALSVLVLYWLVRRTMSGTFVSGGRGRRPRLAVLDAAAVDSRRRIVLVRRDETEHLILIGGPTDVVIEQGIQTDVAAVQPAATKAEKPAKESPKKAEPVETAEPKVAKVDDRKVAVKREVPIPEKQVERAADSPPPPAATVEPIVPARRATDVDRVSASEAPLASAPAPERHTGLHTSASVASAVAAERFAPPTPKPEPSPPVATEINRPQEAPALTATPASGSTDLDSALLRELESTLDRPPANEPQPRKTGEIDEEMAEMIAEMGRERA